MIPNTDQRSLFKDERADKNEICSKTPQAIPDFVAPDPERIFIGEKRLRAYLIENGLGWVVRMRETLMGMELSELRTKYHPSGRRPIDPAVLLGFILYGMLMKHWSLRELEGLARRDLGAWWLLGGLTPDHSTIGNFITRHEKELSSELFEQLTGQLLKRLKIEGSDVAGDGTVIEAMASRYQVLKKEALQEKVQQARQEPEAQDKIQRLNDAEAKLEERREKRGQQGKSNEAVQISPIEPEAYVQPLKNKTKRPSYKPSILANEQRMIVGQYVDASSESVAIEPMLNQHERLTGEQVKRLLLDAGYNNTTVFRAAISRDIDLLCPSGKRIEAGPPRERESRKYRKSEFSYQAELDNYQCPQGEVLTYENRGQDRNGLDYRKYRCHKCNECPVKEMCTKSPSGRTIKRYEVDEYKEAMRQVLMQDRAREQYRRRQGIVEPVFAELKYRQGLNRFQRSGLKRVRVEFSLHCMAYNIKRAFQVENRGLFMCFELRVYDQRGQLLSRGMVVGVF